MKVNSFIYFLGCGYPGRPGYGKIILKRDGFRMKQSKREWTVGDKVLLKFPKTTLKIVPTDQSQVKFS